MIKEDDIDENIKPQIAAQAVKVGDYYARVAKGEGGAPLADMLNSLNTLRDHFINDKDLTLVNRSNINNMLKKILAIYES